MKKSNKEVPTIGYRFQLGNGIGLAVVSVGAMSIDLINNWSYGREYSLLLGAMLAFAAFCVVALPVSAELLGWNWQRVFGTIICVSLTVISGFSAYLAKEPTITPLAEFVSNLIGCTHVASGQALTLITTTLCITITQIVALMAGDAFALIGAGLKARERALKAKEAASKPRPPRSKPVINDSGKVTKIRKQLAAA